MFIEVVGKSSKSPNIAYKSLINLSEIKRIAESSTGATIFYFDNETIMSNTRYDDIKEIISRSETIG